MFVVRKLQGWGENTAKAELRDRQFPDIVLDRSLQLHLVEMPKAERHPSQTHHALAKWVERAKAEAIEAEAKGRTTERTDIPRRQLRLKFGQLPDSAEQQLQHASQAQLEYWAEQVLFADTLDQVFARQIQ